MSLIKVDEEKCIRCGSCIEECPFRLMEMKTADSPPTPREMDVRTAQERCINCGHCVAVCPTGAMELFPTPHTLRNFPPPLSVPEHQSPEELLPLRPELKVSKEQMAHLLMTRRTHRAYKDKPVPRETLEAVIDVARYAPSGHNNQLVNWIIISDKSEIRRLGQSVIDFMKANTKSNLDLPYYWDHYATDSDVIVDLWQKGVDSVFRGAPHLVILTGPRGMGKNFVARETHTIRMAYFELAAIPYDLATVWAGFFIAAMKLWPPAAEALELARGEEALDAIGIGYPKNRFRRMPLRNKPNIQWR
jgi:ferredoxin